MESWGHVITAREVIREEDSPVERCSTRVERIREKRKKKKEVDSDQSPYNEEQSRSKNGILLRQERRHEIGKRL